MTSDILQKNKKYIMSVTILYNVYGSTEARASPKINLSKRGLLRFEILRVNKKFRASLE